MPQSEKKKHANSLNLSLLKPLNNELTNQQLWSGGQHFAGLGGARRRARRLGPIALASGRRCTCTGVPRGSASTRGVFVCARVRVRVYGYNC
jgi:hypothetical protein